MELYRPGIDQLNREFDHYRDIVAKSYTGLSNQQAYDLAYYDNLETIDPLGRCLYYRGTDQRDFFIPRLKALFGKLPDQARIGDFGAGDGQTAAMAYSAIPGTALIDIIEPSPAIKKYEAYIHGAPNLTLSKAIQTGIGAVDAPDALAAIPDNSLDMALCLHAIYFFEITRGVLTMYRKLKPGGTLFIVFADETRSTTGRAITGYFNDIGRADVATEHHKVFEQRVQLLGAHDTAQSIASIIQTEFGKAPSMKIEDAPSRFYADKFGNMAAFGLLSGLPFFEPDDSPAQSDQFNTAKILSVLTSMRDRAHEFDLGIVNDVTNPRHGMWTTTQAQKIVTIGKV